ESRLQLGSRRNRLIAEEWSRRMKLEGLVFDMDGTLVDTEELHRQAFNQAFLEFGLGWEWSPELYTQLLVVSGGVDRIASYIDSLGLPAAEKTRLRRLI